MWFHNINRCLHYVAFTELGSTTLEVWETSAGNIKSYTKYTFWYVIGFLSIIKLCQLGLVLDEEVLPVFSCSGFWQRRNGPVMNNGMDIFVRAVRWGKTKLYLICRASRSHGYRGFFPKNFHRIPRNLNFDLFYSF